MESRYSILNPLEPGPDCTLYLVSDLLDSGARKVLSLVPRCNGYSLEKLESNYLLRRSLDHPLLPAVTDISFRGAARLGLVSEFLPGTSFAQKLPRLKISQMKIMAAQLAELLHFMHCRGCYAGYLTPSKLFLGSEAQPKLGFRWPGQISLSQCQRMDSIRYCAPELIAESACTSQTDVYSLGMLFYLLFTGKQPFSEHDPNTLRQKQLVAYPADPRKLNTDLPRKIGSLILSQIQKKPDRRPPLTEVISTLRDGLPGNVVLTPRFRSTLVGRKKETRIFNDLCEDFLARPRSRFVTIKGVAGIGKTFLAEHFETMAKFKGIRTFSIQHHSGDATGEAFRQFSSSSTLSRTDIPTFIESVVESIRRQCRKNPLLIRVSDLQWMDQVSLRIFEKLLCPNEFPIVVLAELSGNSDYKTWNRLQSFLASTRAEIQLTLPPLATTEVDELIRLTTANETLKKLSGHLADFCGGIPGHTLEILSCMQRDDLLHFYMGKWIPNKTEYPDLSDLPQNVTESLRLAVGNLTVQQKEILEITSLLDDSIPVDILRPVVNTDLESVLQNLQVLAIAGHIILEGELAHPVIKLSYGLLKVFLHQQLSTDRKRSMRRRISESLEQYFRRTRDPQILVILVRQLLQAGLLDRSRHFLPRALEYLKSQNQFREASSLLKMAGSSGAISTFQPQFLQDHVELLYLSGCLDECIETINSAIAGGWAGDKEAILLALRGKIQISRGQNVEGDMSLRRALIALGQFPSPRTNGEVWADMLSSLSCTGKIAGARRVAARLLRGIKRSESRLVDDKLYHALFLYYSFAEGAHSGEAIKWERKSVVQALRCGNSVRYMGRLFNIASASLKMGRWHIGSRLNKHLSVLVGEIGNPEVDAYIKTNCCIELRKHGKHLEAQQSLDRLLKSAYDGNQNLHLQCEWQTELAKNFNYSLEPEKALCELSRLDKISEFQKYSSTILDAELAKGWTEVLLGRPGKANQIVEELRHIRDGRIQLLSGQARVALEDLEGALEDARAALGLFPKSMPYYRTRARLLQAEVLTRAPYLGEAGPYITDALRTSKDEFYAPLLARAYMMKGRWLAQKGNPGYGRVHCLRALQVARKVERPGLRAEIYRTLGNIEAALNRREQANECFDQALQILRERCLRLSPPNRGDFSDTHIGPLEDEQAKLIGGLTRQPPRSLIHSRDLTRTLLFTQQEDFPDVLMQSIKKVSPLISANLFLRSEQNGSFHLVARRGRCRHSGRHSLPMLKRNHPAVPRVVTNRSGYALAVPLNTKQRIEGFLYVERGGGGISELEFDTLTSLADTSGLYLQGCLAQQRPKRVESGARAPRSNQRIVGRDPAILTMLGEIDKIAPLASNVLIEGETGSGKELVAKAIHERSGRIRSRFKPLNCSTLPDYLVESELFGHIRGAFTGANRDKMGLFEAASGGTLFLDEISTLPLGLQSSLLRVLEERKIRRVGDTEERRVNTRVIAATNRSLRRMVLEGGFRSDLYHRLNVFQIEVPPLRERMGDLEELCTHFLDQLSTENERSVSLSEDALTRMRKHHFPGNVRELRNLLENLFHTSRTGLITATHVDARLSIETPARHRSTPRHLERILDRLASGHGDFWELVRDPFLNRDLSRADVRWIIATGLRTCAGSYKKLVEYFGMDDGDYKRFLAFLSTHDCKVDFRPYRRK